MIKIFPNFIVRRQTQYNQKTDWSSFGDVIENNLEFKISLKDGDQIEKVIVDLNDVIVDATTRSTPIIEFSRKTLKTPDFIQTKIKQKRKLRKNGKELCTRSTKLPITNQL